MRRYWVSLIVWMFVWVPVLAAPRSTQETDSDSDAVYEQLVEVSDRVFDLEARAEEEPDTVDWAVLEAGYRAELAALGGIEGDHSYIPRSGLLARIHRGLGESLRPDRRAGGSWEEALRNFELAGELALRDSDSLSYVLPQCLEGIAACHDPRRNPDGSWDLHIQTLRRIALHLLTQWEEYDVVAEVLLREAEALRPDVNPDGSWAQAALRYEGAANLLDQAAAETDDWDPERVTEEERLASFRDRMGRAGRAMREAGTCMLTSRNPHGSDAFAIWRLESAIGYLYETEDIPELLATSALMQEAQDRLGIPEEDREYGPGFGAGLYVDRAWVHYENEEWTLAGAAFFRAAEVAPDAEDAVQYCRDAAEMFREAGMRKEMLDGFARECEYLERTEDAYWEEILERYEKLLPGCEATGDAALVERVRAGVARCRAKLDG